MIFAITTLVVVIVLTRRGRKPTVQGVRCPHCAATAPDGAVLCPRCGRSLRSSASTPDSPPLATAQPATAGQLVAVEGLPAGRAYPIPPPPKGLAIGRERSNDVALTDDPLVSRRHAQVMLEGGQYVLYDRDSVNGVFVNNRRVMRHVLSEGDTVQISSAVFRFTQQEGVLSTLPPPSRPETGEVPPSKPSRPSGAVPPKPAEEPKVDSMRLVGKTEFEGYVLDRKVGQGGMSVVYKAYDPQGQPVAIKVLDVTDEYVVKKFIQEGEIGITLRGHPNVCTVHCSGRARDERLYLVMEYIEGTSLRAKIGQDLSEDEIVRIVGQVCDALHYAHLRHIVHRDIKPENILIDKEGMVKVADFGIAKLTSSVTVTKNRLMGTPEYISPEQAQAQRILPTSDVYSVGVVLYELLAGQPPFPLPPYESLTQERVAFNRVLYDHIKKKPAPLSDLRPSISKTMERVVLKALEKEPQRRYATAWQMAQALGFQRTIATPPAPRRMQARLVVVHGAQQGKRIALGETPTTLGRRDIAPDDAYISNQHMTISPRGERLWLEDMSRNGTWVNGERIYGETPLQSGDEIAVGSQILRVEVSTG